MKTIGIIIGGALVIGLIGFWQGWWGAAAPEEVMDQNDQTPAQTETVRGTIVEIDTEGAMVDGPYVVVVRAEDGSETTIAIPSMGILLCEARDNIAAIDDLEVGMTVEAAGSVGPAGQIVPCESASHFVQIVAQ